MRKEEQPEPTREALVIEFVIQANRIKALANWLNLVHYLHLQLVEAIG